MDASAPTISPPLSITLQLPVPPSVNRTRRIDWAGLRALKEFYLRTDLFLSAHGPRPAPVRVVTGAYELLVQIPDGGSVDLDNHVKTLIDYLVSREFVVDDRRRFLRRLVVEWSNTEHVHVTITRTSDG